MVSTFRVAGKGYGLLAGSLMLALLPLTAQAQINRARPPSGGSSGGGGNSGGAVNRQPSGSGYSGTRTPPTGGSGYQRQGSTTGTSGNLNSGYNSGNQGNGSSSGSQSGSFNRSRPNNSQNGGSSGYPSFNRTSSGINNLDSSYSFNRFHRTAEGSQFRYNNGVFGRSTRFYYNNWGSGYFPGSWGWYPYYYPTFVSGISLWSPYYGYYGLFPPYISAGYVSYAAPYYVYVPVPVYQGTTFRYWNYNTDVDDYYLNRDKNSDYRIGEKEAAQDKDLNQTVDDIRLSWQKGDIDLLAKHTSRDAKIAVYVRGKYEYSLEAGDYLDMTRDAFRTTKTVRFEIDNIRKRQTGIYTVTARHTYRDKEDKERVVFVSYVLEKRNGEYVLTQISTAPDKQQ